MAVVLYIWLIPLALVIVGSLGSLYLCVRQDWSAQTQRENRSDLEIALDMEAREDAEAVRASKPPEIQVNPS